MARRIIINADDLGLSPSVNTAIFDVFRAGNLTSATLMVNMPGTEDAVRRLKDHPGLSVGLHFCLTEGNALTGTSGLTEASGAFRPRPELARRSLRGAVQAAEVQRELEAQLAAMDRLGVKPTHVDSHQHVHMLPAVLSGMLPVLRERGLAMRVVRPPSSAVGAAWRRPKKVMKQLLNAYLADRACRRSGLRTNDLLVSIHDLDHTGPYQASTYLELLAGTPQDALVEVMVHPYVLGPDVLQLYASEAESKGPFLRRCAAEHAALTQGPVFSGMRSVDFSAA